MNEPHLSRAWRPGSPADPLAGELCQDRCPDIELNIVQQLLRRQFTTIHLPNVYIKLTAAAALVVCIYRIRYKRESFNETLFIKGNKIIPWQLQKYCALLGESVPGVVHDGVVVVPCKKVLIVTHLV